jgi:MscS family membrane protein
MTSHYISILQQYVPNQWAQAGFILLLFVVISLIFNMLINRVVIKLTKKTKTKVDDIIVGKSRKPLFLIILFLGIKAALIPLKINGILDKIAGSISSVIFVYLIGSVISILLESWGKHVATKTKTRMDETILPLLQRASGVVFILVAVMWIFKIWGINITPYLAGLGISGLVLGLALQDSLKNIFGGLSLILDRNFNIGDKIKLESGELGEILDIGLRSTKLITYDNETIFIPNGQLANMRIQNYVQPNPRVRVTVNFSVIYGSKVEKVKKVVEDSLRKMKDISDKPYLNVVFLEMADFSLNFQARFFVDDYRDAYSKKLEATEVIYNALNKAEIEIPFPTRTVYMKQGK